MTLFDIISPTDYTYVESHVGSWRQHFQAGSAAQADILKRSESYGVTKLVVACTIIKSGQGWLIGQTLGKQTQSVEPHC